MDVNAYEQMNAYAGMLISPEPPMCEATSNDLSVVAAFEDQRIGIGRGNG